MYLCMALFAIKKGSELIATCKKQKLTLSDAGAIASEESSDFMVDNNQLTMLAVCVWALLGPCVAINSIVLLPSVHGHLPSCGANW